MQEDPKLGGMPISMPEDWQFLVLIVILIGFIIPIVEELFFRGIIYSLLRNNLRQLYSYLISAVIFGMVHTSLPVAVAAFFSGLLLAWIAENSQSIFPPIISHVINNSIKISILIFSLTSYA
jgi:hypothetical protein